MFQCLIYVVIGSLLFAALSTQAEEIDAGSGKRSYVENLSKLENYKPTKNDFKIYFIGDSITRHHCDKRTIEKLKWKYIAGMAASSEEKDYAHLLAAKIGEMLPNKKICLFFGKGGNPVKALTGIAVARAYRPDLIIVQLGEHEKKVYLGKGGKKQVRDNYSKLLDELLKIESRPLIICTGIWNISGKNNKYTWWTAGVDKIQREVCREKNIPFASVEKYGLNPACSGSGEHNGVRWHPNDAGHASYAKELFKLFKQNYITDNPGSK